MTRIAAKFRKKIPGARGHAQFFIDLMYSDYQRLNSLSKVAKLHGVTRQSLWEMFKHRGLKMNPQKVTPCRVHKGLKYYRTDKGHYWRHRSNRRAPYEILKLHQEIWKEAHGTIPLGHYVGFKDGNNDNCDLKNLVCLPKGEMSKLIYRRNYPNRVNWTAEDYRLHLNGIALRCHKRKRAKNLARGLTAKGTLRKNFGAKAAAQRKEWDFVYVPVVRETRDEKVVRRHVGRFTPSGALGDLFREIHREADRLAPSYSWDVGMRDRRDE